MRARAALEAVSSRCRVVLGEESCYYKEDWCNLKTSLPRFRKRKQGEQQVAVVDGSGEPVASECAGFDAMESRDAFMFRRARRLNRSICHWRNLDMTESQFLVSDAKSRLSGIKRNANVDTLQLRRLLYDVIGALSPPRAKPIPSAHPVPMDILAAERLKTTAAVQYDVRAILTIGLSLWRNSLWLEDVQVEPILTHVKHLIRSFEQTHGQLYHACAKKQWQKLKHIVGLVEHESPVAAFEDCHASTDQKCSKPPLDGAAAIEVPTTKRCLGEHELADSSDTRHTKDYGDCYDNPAVDCGVPGKRQKRQVVCERVVVASRKASVVEGVFTPSDRVEQL